MLSEREDDFTNFYVTFEIGRLAIDDPSKLLSADKNFGIKICMIIFRHLKVRRHQREYRKAA